jgi:hypothetical protein
MAIPVFHATVTEAGRVVLAASEARIRHNYLTRLAGKAIDVTIREHHDRRTLDQNAWWWGVALPVIAAALGYDRHEHDRLHYALVDLCFGTTFDPRIGREVSNARSSQLTTAQFSALMDWVVRWAATEQGITVPRPGDGVAA